MIPATAGAAITEQELRTYLKCSQLFHYGGGQQAPIEMRMAQATTEYWLSAHLRRSGLDKSYEITRAVLRASQSTGLQTKYLAGQIEGIQNRTILWLDEFLKLFNSKVYNVVAGPLPWRVQLSRTAIDLHFSGMFRTVKNKTLHLLSFSPYRDLHSQANDPLTHLKLRALKEFAPASHQRPQAIMHLVWVQENGGLGYNSVSSFEMNPNYIEMITAKLQEMERGTHFPALPCRYSCKYKEKCYPGTKQ